MEGCRIFDVGNERAIYNNTKPDPPNRDNKENIFFGIHKQCEWKLKDYARGGLFVEADK